MIQPNTERPAILVVDDEADDLRNTFDLRLGAKAELTVRHPADVRTEDLGRADLILMDFRLDNWAERDRQPAGFSIQTGLALATVLREAVDKGDQEHATAVALHTAHLADASGRLRPPHSRHVVARLNNLEWVFEKDDPNRLPSMIMLAEAAQRLRGTWPEKPSASEARLRALLGLDDETEWFERAWREVRACQPPVYELGGGSHGVLVLRWLLHQVFPYPTFLWSAPWVAAGLGIREEDLERALATDSELAHDLQQRRYIGILAGFAGPRWWRTAVEDYAWELGGGSSGEPHEYWKRLQEKAGVAIEPVSVRDPVVCLDRNFEPDGVDSPRNAVRVRPDYWPPFADAPWMRMETVREDPELRAMVEPVDQYRVVP